MSIEIRIGYGILNDSIAEQLATQGYKAKNVNTLEKYRKSIVQLLFAGVITDSESDKAFGRLQKMIMGSIEPIE